MGMYGKYVRGGRYQWKKKEGSRNTYVYNEFGQRIRVASEEDADYYMLDEKEEEKKRNKKLPIWIRRLKIDDAMYQKPTSYKDHADWYDWRTPLSPVLDIISRPAWGATEHEESESDRLIAPVRNITVLYTGSDGCFNREECLRTVQTLQKSSLEKGLSDIPYNFLIGTDNTVYEGTGWDVNVTKVNKLYKYRAFNKKSLDIAFIGLYFKERNNKDFRSYWPKKSFVIPMMITLERLIKHGVARNYIVDDFDIYNEIHC